MEKILRHYSIFISARTSLNLKSYIAEAQSITPFSIDEICVILKKNFKRIAPVHYVGEFVFVGSSEVNSISCITNSVSVDLVCIIIVGFSIS